LCKQFFHTRNIDDSSTALIIAILVHYKSFKILAIIFALELGGNEAIGDNGTIGTKFAIADSITLGLSNDK